MTRPPPPEVLASARLLDFAKLMWPSLEVAPHHRLIARALESVERGDCKRLMIFTPPRHSKSLLASQMFPAWTLGRNPTKQIITSTYAQDLADDFGRQVRNTIADDVFRRVFPSVRLRSDSTSARRFHTTQGGVYVAVGAGGPITGRGAHWAMIDDPFKNREEANSPTIRRKIIQWYTSTLYTRLMPGGAIILIQTRWHEGDLAGWLLKEHAAEGWTVLNLPALAETTERWDLGRGEVWTRAPGEALWPKWYPTSRLEEIKQAVGTMDWSALYQQRPAPAEGGMFKLEWVAQRYRETPGEVMARARRVALSLDTAVKAAEMNDPTCATVWAECDDGNYLLAVEWIRLEYPALRQRVLTLAQQWRPHAVLIEDKASGSTLLQDLRVSSQLPVLAFEPGQRSKEVRWQAVTPLLEAGRVKLPQQADWLPDYEAELLHFPQGAHDDAVDSTSQYLNWVRGQVQVDLAGAYVRDADRFDQLEAAWRPSW